MKYLDAIKLHNGDEVMLKKTGEILTVMWTEDQKGRKECYLHCDDGYSYLHREVK